MDCQTTKAAIETDAAARKASPVFCERKIAIGNLAECDSIRVVEDVTQVPQHRYMPVLPDDDESRCGEQRRRHQPFNGQRAGIKSCSGNPGRTLCERTIK